MKQKKLTIKIKLLIIFCITSSSSWSQNAKDTTLPVADTFDIQYKNYVKSYWFDYKSLVMLPSKKIKSRDLISIGAISATTALLFSQDNNIHDFFQSNKSAHTDFLAKNVFEPIGSGKIPIPIMACMFIYGNVAKKTRPVMASMNGLKSFIIATSLIQIPKYSLQRQRPYVSPYNSFKWFNGIDGSHYLSFPSGHTTAAFAFATSFALEYNDKKWMAPICYTFAAFAGLSRINDNKHWASDVFMGAVLGHTITKFLYRKKNWNVTYTIHSSSYTPSILICKSF